MNAVRAELLEEYAACELARPYRRTRYDPGDQLRYEVTGVVPARRAQVVAEVEKAVGGGFAGQVYRVQLVGIEAEDGGVAGLEVGSHYAVKILKPGSGLKQAFRDFLFFLGYQTHFAAQVNPAAVRVGVLWQKLIRRAMALEFGATDAVCDTFATFYDAELGSFGEINEWIDGRSWKFEVDDRLFARWDFADRPPADHNSPEYVSKKLFMRELVSLLHEMGAPELARQYEWWTCKSQPNVMKRIGAGDGPQAGLTAVDFRAGLTLLPFLPMSPVDLPLILSGLVHGRLVQFDRSQPEKLAAFVQQRREAFSDLQPALEELAHREVAYRAAMLDLTHHGLRPLWDGRLRRSIRDGVITAWQSLGRVDAVRAQRLRHNALLFHLAAVVALVPLVGRRLLKWWGDATTRAHLRQCLTSPAYLWRAMRGARIETLVVWQRAGRLADARLLALVRRPARFWLHRLCCGFLPAKWHRALTDWSWGWQRVRAAVGFIVRFLREPEFRNDWLLAEVRRGREEGMLTADEAERVTVQIQSPYIQKYLKCLAVHLCTVPVTQIVMLIAGGGVAAYWYVTKGAGWVEAAAAGSATAALIQLSPVSPGSMARGLFVVFLMIRERDVKNYYVAAPVAFIHVLGYLAFPLQMVTQNPALARFLAGSWAKKVVHIVPVFGEPGALLEHAVFDLFFNLPLSLKRSFKARPLVWSAGVLVTMSVLATVAVLAYARLWEWRQPELRLEAARVVSVTPYARSGVELHWRTSGTRVRFAHDTLAAEDPVDYPAQHWDETVYVDDQVDAVVRKKFFGNEYDGLVITKRSADVRLPSMSTQPSVSD